MFSRKQGHLANWIYECWKQFVFHLFREIIHEKGDVIARKRFKANSRGRTEELSADLRLDWQSRIEKKGFSISSGKGEPLSSVLEGHSKIPICPSCRLDVAQ